MSDESLEPPPGDMDHLRAAVQAMLVMNLQTVTTFYNIIGAFRSGDTEKGRLFINNAERTVQELQRTTTSLGELFFKAGDGT